MPTRWGRTAPAENSINGAECAAAPCMPPLATSRKNAKTTPLARTRSRPPGQVHSPGASPHAHSGAGRPFFCGRRGPSGNAEPFPLCTLVVELFATRQTALPFGRPGQSLPHPRFQALPEQGHISGIEGQNPGQEVLHIPHGREKGHRSSTHGNGQEFPEDIF